MLIKKDIQLISSLKMKKFRQQHSLFVAEGPKLVEELLKKPDLIEKVYHTKDYLPNDNSEVFTEISQRELEKLSYLKTPNQVLALVKIFNEKLDLAAITKQLVLGLESIRDPGNLGTIIRIADWFGIEHILCSEDCVDLYNPKTVQASMGSIFRVDIHYVDLETTLKQLQGKVPIYATSLNGENIYTHELSQNGILLTGNEANGLTESIMELADKHLHIPSFNKSGDGAESLNAAFACAIACSEFKRRS